MNANLERTLNTAQQNKDQTTPPQTMGVAMNNEPSTTPEPLPSSVQQPNPRWGLRTAVKAIFTGQTSAFVFFILHFPSRRVASFSD